MTAFIALLKREERGLPFSNYVLAFFLRWSGLPPG